MKNPHYFRATVGRVNWKWPLSRFEMICHCICLKSLTISNLMWKEKVTILYYKSLKIINVNKDVWLFCVLFHNVDRSSQVSTGIIDVGKVHDAKIINKYDRPRKQVHCWFQFRPQSSPHIEHLQFIRSSLLLKSGDVVG